MGYNFEKSRTIEEVAVKQQLLKNILTIVQDKEIRQNFDNEEYDLLKNFIKDSILDSISFFNERKISDEFDKCYK